MNYAVTIRGIEDVNRILMELAPNEAKNVLRGTTYDMAAKLAEIAISHTPDNPNTGKGDLHTSIKPQRGRGSATRVEASVNVMNIRRNYFWIFLERGQGPDHVEYAMFLKALQEVRPDIDRVYMESFAKKLIARLIRERNRVIP